MLTAVTATAATEKLFEWALVREDGVVINVIVASNEAVALREDGPWIKCYKKVGKGHTYDGLHFRAPVSTFTVVVSSTTL